MKVLDPSGPPGGGCTAVGLEDVHLHDLRHTGNTYAAEVGASLRELMERMGHSSTRAAMVYLHARDDRARDIADALGERAADELKRSGGSGDSADSDSSTDGDATGDGDEDDPPAAAAPV